MWKLIEGTNGYYEVSSEGQVRNVRTGRVLKPMMVGGAGNKYPKVVLCVDGLQRGAMVHHLVAAAFIGPRPEGLVVRHRNGDRTDNRRRNLQYGTQRDNMRDARRHHQHKHKLTLRQIEKIRSLRAKGHKGRDLAKEFGVSEQYVCDIHNGRK